MRFSECIKEYGGALQDVYTRQGQCAVMKKRTGSDDGEGEENKSVASCVMMGMVILTQFGA